MSDPQLDTPLIVPETPRTRDTSIHTESILESIDEVWYLKEISFRPTPTSEPRKYKIITQNNNGPCSFIAICNILILRDKIQIEPYHREAVSYEYLSQLLAEHLLLSSSDVDISAALSTMPATRKGMDLNPLFTGCTSFRPATTGGELELFEKAGIKLVHGWLVDPSSPEYRVLSRTEDYDSSVNLLVEADTLTKGQFMVADDMPTASASYQGPAFVEGSSSQAGPSSYAGSSSQGASSSRSPPIRQTSYTLSPKEQQKVEDALIVRSFIESASSQLTYHGLFTLSAMLEPNALVALFRNSHLSVLYKAPSVPGPGPAEGGSSQGGDSGGGLYTLVTDHIFFNESSVVWERLEDVDGRWSTFVDSDFIRSSPAGGDYAGHTAESALAALEEGTGALTLADRADATLAEQLQAEEYERMNRLATLREKREQEKREREQREAERRRKRKKDCVIM